MNEKLRTVDLSELMRSAKTEPGWGRGAIIVCATLEAALLLGVVWLLYARL